MGHIEDKGYTIKEDGTIVRDTKSSKVNQMKNKISLGGNGNNPNHKKEGNHSYTWILLFFIVGIIIAGIAMYGGGDDGLSSDINYQSSEEEVTNDVEQNNSSELSEVSQDPLGLCPDVNHPHEIDMGNGLKWACCNVGAASPIEYGDYFAYGEISPKESYKWDSYKWCNGDGNSMTKYDDDVDNLSKLELSDDAARYIWGASWRMPTEPEIEILLQDCDWSWVSIGSTYGCKVTSQSGNAIFFPAAGYCGGNDYKYNKDHYGWYWVSTVPSLDGFGLSFVFGENNKQTTEMHLRYMGFSIRPVTK